MKQRSPSTADFSKPAALLLALVFALAAATIACNGPAWMIPGGEFRGPVGHASSWQVAEGFESLQLETNSGNPYSVNIGFTLRDGRLYIDPAEERRWYRHLVSNPNVRVRFDQTIYLARAVPVENGEELAGFDASRRVFRLELNP